MTDVKVDRELAIANSTDPFGKQWGIRAIQGYGMYHIGRIEDGSFTIPRGYPKDSGLEGKFTKTTGAEEAIRRFLLASWDYADTKALHAASKKRAKEESIATKAT